MPLTIKLDDNEFTLSNECLRAMATTLWHTKVKERGLMLCQDEEVTPGDEHIGGSRSIKARNCRVLSPIPEISRGRPRVGYYHTHPISDSAPSWLDAYSILSQSYWHDKPWLGCRGSKVDETIRCETVRRLPTLLEVQGLKKRLPRMRGTAAEDDPDIMLYLTKPYSFPVRKVPEIMKPPVPVPVAPKIKTEEVVFAESRFIRYTNLDTGETRIERVY